MQQDRLYLSYGCANEPIAAAKCPTDGQHQAGTPSTSWACKPKECCGHVGHTRGGVPNSISMAWR